jgi:hypothetical protein
VRACARAPMRCALCRWTCHPLPWLRPHADQLMPLRARFGTAGPTGLRAALLLVRSWAKARGIYGPTFGFPAGISWALLTAATCQRLPPGAHACLRTPACVPASVRGVRGRG